MSGPGLLPCPFCGEPADFGRTGSAREAVPFVNCTGCLAALGHLMPDPGMDEQAVADQWNSRTGGAAPIAGVPGLLVLECTRPLTEQQRETMRLISERALPPGARLLVLEPGVRLARPDVDALHRLEAKVDSLIAALADEGGEPDAGDPLASLDGGRAPVRAPTPFL